MSKGNGGGRMGNLGNRELADQEKAARLKADRLLNKATPLAVMTLIRILKNPKSTNIDKNHAATAILDRKLPKVTQSEMVLRGLRPILLQVEGGLGWPEMEPTTNGNGAHGDT